MTTYFTPVPRLPFHRETCDRPRGRILEVSSRSPDELGRQLSAMNLRAADDPLRRTVEAVYQAAKTYGAGGPATPARSGYEAKRIDRERRRQGPLTGFEYAGRRWALETGTAFYDWLWARSALAAYGPKIIERLQEYDGFTDQFHRPGAKACQAKTAAMVAGMGERTRRAAADPDAWLFELNPARRAEPEGHRRYAGIGSRQTPAPVLEQMRSIGAAMAEAGWLLRSGAAQGADSAFETGAADAGGNREIWIPWDRYNDRTPDNGPTIRIARHNDANRSIASRRHPRWNALSAGAQKLMVRNVHQILGDDPATPDPVDLVICWTPRASGSGGTGMALRLANDQGIPVVDLGADRAHLRQAVERARQRGLPETAARLIADPARHAPGSTYRVVVAGESRPADRAAIERHLGELAARHPSLTVVPAGEFAGDAAALWANANGHRVEYPPGRGQADTPEPRSARAARILMPRSDLVLDCRTDWDANVQAVVDAAEMDNIPVTTCPGIERRLSSTEHALEQAHAEREKAPDAPAKAPAPASPARRGPYARIDDHADHRLRLDPESRRIARAATRRHRMTEPKLLDRALMVANSEKRATLLEAGTWTTRDRMAHDPLGALTAGITAETLAQVLATARTIANALRRAQLERTASVAHEPSQAGTRQTYIARDQHHPTR